MEIIDLKTRSSLKSQPNSETALQHGLFSVIVSVLDISPPKTFYLHLRLASLRGIMEKLR